MAGGVQERVIDGSRYAAASRRGPGPPGYELTANGEWLLRIAYVTYDGIAAHAHSIRIRESIDGGYREGPVEAAAVDRDERVVFDFVALALAKVGGRVVRFEVSAFTLSPVDDEICDLVLESHGVVLVATSAADLARARALLAELECPPLAVALEGYEFSEDDVAATLAQLGPFVARTSAIASGKDTFEPLKMIAKLTLRAFVKHAAGRDFETATPDIVVDRRSSRPWWRFW